MAAMSDLPAPLEVHRTPILVLDLGGTIAFALNGAMAGIRRSLDVFGVLVLGAAIVALRRGWHLPRPPE